MDEKPTTEEMLAWIENDIETKQWDLRLGVDDRFWPERDIRFLTAIRDELARPNPSVTIRGVENHAYHMLLWINGSEPDKKSQKAFAAKEAELLRSLGVEVREEKKEADQ